MAVDRWRCVKSTRGVCHLLSREPTLGPCSISSEVVESLRSQEDDGVVSLASLGLFRQGEQIKIVQGPFADQVAIFQKMTNDQRVEVLLNFLNKDIFVHLEKSAVEKLS